MSEILSYLGKGPLGDAYGSMLDAEILVCGFPSPRAHRRRGRRGWRLGRCMAVSFALGTENPVRGARGCGRVLPKGGRRH